MKRTHWDTPCIVFTLQRPEDKIRQIQNWFTPAFTKPQFCERFISIFRLFRELFILLESRETVPKDPEPTDTADPFSDVMAQLAPALIISSSQVWFYRILLGKHVFLELLLRVE